MEDNLEPLKLLLIKQDLLSQKFASNSDIQTFEHNNTLRIPVDMQEYFKEVNGMNGRLDSSLFELYSFDEFIPIIAKYGDWGGIPSYRDIQVTMNDHNNCFVIGNWMMHTFAYAIRLNEILTTSNEVFIICGGDFQVIANSFTEFLELYLEDSELLYYSD